jgi:hypothetical protein
MTLSRTSSRAVDLDDLERQMRDVAALAPRALKKRSRLSSYVLALAEPLLLVTVGVGLAAVMRAGPTDAFPPCQCEVKHLSRAI